MPSDAKKKQAQKKKDAAKARQSGKKPTKIENEEKESSPIEMNGTKEENGSVEISAEGNIHFKMFISLLINCYMLQIFYWLFLTKSLLPIVLLQNI